MKTFKIVRTRTAKQVQSRPDQTRQDPVRNGKHVRHFDASLDLSGDDRKSFDPVKNGDRVVDYQNVRIKGYLSTFQSTTPSDRDGDYVKPGAFTDTIPLFLKNPVLLVNHRNDVQSIAGKFTTVQEDRKGLYVEAQLSDSPVEWMRDVRWKVANGELKTLSMGGFFFYGEDGRAIEKVSLYEGSLVPIPANPDAIVSTRELTEHEKKIVQAET